MKEVLNTFIVRYGLDPNDYMRYKSMLITGLSDLNLTTLLDYDTVEITPDNLNHCQLPPDCEIIHLVALNYNERLFELSENPNIVILDQVVCGEETRDVQASNSNIKQFFPCGWGDSLPAIRGGYNNVYYKLDKKHNRLVLEGNVPLSTIIVQYFTNGISLNSETYIPRYAMKCLLAYLNWSIDEGDVLKGRMFATEEKRLKQISHPMDKATLLDTIYRGISNGLKR
jgi:hypothetical protein